MPCVHLLCLKGIGIQICQVLFQVQTVLNSSAALKGPYKTLKNCWALPARRVYAYRRTEALQSAQISLKMGPRHSALSCRGPSHLRHQKCRRFRLVSQCTNP